MLCMVWETSCGNAVIVYEIRVCTALWHFRQNKVANIFGISGPSKVHALPLGIEGRT